MGNKATKKISANAPDQDAVFITAMAIGDSGSPSGQRPTYCPHGVINTGDSPSFFHVSTPINEFGDEQAPAVALKLSGIAGRIQPGSRMSVQMIHSNNKSQTLLNGTLLKYTHVFGHGGKHEDSVISLILDDRFLLSKVTCFDKATYDPKSGKYWLDPELLIFNKLGYPDCIDTPYGPRFAPEYRYGYGPTDFDEPSPGSATTRARSWRVIDILKYLRDMYYATGGARPHMPENYGRNVVSRWVQWSRGFESAVGGDRTVKHLELQGDSVLLALSKVLRKAGPYDLTCEPIGSGSSQLGIANMGPNNTAAGSGMTLMLPDYDTDLDVGALLNTSNCIHSGYLDESVINYFHQTTNLGDPPVVERFVSTKTTRAGGDANTPIESLGALEPAWDRGVDANGVAIPIGTNPTVISDEWKFLNYISNVDLLPNSFAAFKRATEQWPNVFTRYRIKRNYALWLGTKYASHMPLDSHPRMHPHLLSGVSIGGTTSPENFEFKDIKIEVELDPASGYWTQAERFNDLRLDHEGRTFTLNALRDNSTGSVPTTWRKGVGSGDHKAMAEDGTILMKPNHIRACIAIEADFRIAGRDTTDPNNTGARVAGETFNHVSVLKELRHVEWLRRNSRPDGGYSDDGIQYAPAYADNYPDQATAGNELFSDVSSGRVARQAHIRQRDVRRIEYTGQLVMQNMTAGIRPGDPTSVEGRNTIPTFSVVRTVSYDCNEQVMVVDLAAADLRKIYDIPQAQLTKSATTSGSSQSQKPSQSNPQYTSPQSSPKSGSYPDDYDSGSGSGKQSSASNSDQSPGEMEDKAIRDKTPKTGGGRYDSGGAGNGGAAGSAGASGGTKPHRGSITGGYSDNKPDNGVQSDGSFRNAYPDKNASPDKAPGDDSKYSHEKADAGRAQAKQAQKDEAKRAADAKSLSSGDADAKAKQKKIDDGE